MPMTLTDYAGMGAGGGFSPQLPSQESGSEFQDSGVTQAIARWCEAAFEEARADQQQCDEVQEIDKYVDYLRGKQWPEGRPSYRSKPINNRMSRLFWELTALLTDIKPVCDIRATERAKQYIEQEDILNKTTRAWWRNNRVDSKVAMTIVYAILTTGFAKIEWEPNLQFGEGDLQLVPISPRCILPLKPGTDLQSSEAVIYQDVKGVGWVRRKYPERAYAVFPDQDVSQFQADGGAPANVSPQLFQMLTPAFKRVLGSKNRQSQSSAYPMCRYREFWVKDYSINTSDRPVRMGPPAGNDRYRIGYMVPPMARLYPRGRLIVMAGRNIVHDGPNPYWHGFFPFAMCRLNVVPWQLYGMSDLKSWKDLQDIVNQIFAGVIDMIKRAVNPPLFFPSNAIGESARAGIDLSMPGAKVAYSQTAAHEPKVQQTAQLPGFVLQFLQGTEREMDQQSGIATVDEAMRKKQVPGGDTLDQIRNSKQTPIRMKGRNIEDFISDCGMQMVPNFFQFYDRDRRVFLLGSTGSQPQDIDWKASTMVPPDTNPSVHIRKFRFEIMEGSLLSIQRVEKVLALSKLRMAGDLDRKTFFKMLDSLENIYIDVDTVEKNLKIERAEGLMGMPPKGNKKGAQPAKVQ
jgi:hypothetical protein